MTVSPDSAPTAPDAPRRTLRSVIEGRLSPLPNRPRRRPPQIAVRLVAGLLFLLVLGTALLILPGMSTRPLAVNEAAFTTISALSVTGLSIITPATDLTRTGQIVLLGLIQIGGVGFMVVAVTIFRFLGRRVALVDRLTLKDSFGLQSPRTILRLSQNVLIAVFVIEGLGATALYYHWRDELGEERALFYGIFHAVSSFCNAGFDLFGGLPDYPRGIPNDSITLLILGSLIFIGGLGIPVLSDLLTYWRERRLSLHTRMTLVVVTALVLIGGMGLFLSEGRVNGALRDAGWDERFVQSLFQSVSARTAGFAGIQPFETLSPAGQLLMIVLMFIGCAPASMGGGITTGTFAVLVIALWSYARGDSVVTVGGRSLSSESIRRAAAVLVVSLLAVSLSSWLIAITHNTSLDRAVFEVVSAFATCGLTLAFTSELNLFGQFIIGLMMFWGRLGALTIVAALAQQTPTERVQYPEEQVLIG